MPSQFISTRIALTWIALIALTLIGPSLLGMDISHAGYVPAIIMAVAVIKVRMIGLEFMELRHAPIKLRLVFEAMCLIFLLVLVRPFFG